MNSEEKNRALDSRVSSVASAKDAAQAVKLVLELFLEAQRQNAKKITVERQLDGDARAAFFGQHQAEPSKIRDIGGRDTELILAALHERSFYWPDPNDLLFETNKQKARRILFAPLSVFRLQADVSTSRKIGTNTQLTVIDNLEWAAIKPLTENLNLLEYYRVALLSAVKQKSGFVIVNKTVEPYAICGGAVMLALRPDAVYFVDPADHLAEDLHALASNSLVVVALDGLDPIALICNFLSKFANVPELVPSLLSLVHLSFVHRRVARVCGSCARSTPVPPQTILQLPEALRPQAKDSYMFSRGCPSCGNSAYRGSIGLESAVVVDGDLKGLLAKNENAEALTAAAYDKGTRSLLEDGLAKIYSGHTSFEQVLKVTNQISGAFAAAILRENQPPLEKREKSTVAPAPANKGGQPGSHVMLIVEDELNQRDVLEMVFKAEGFEVIGAGNGRHALELLEKHNVDIILCDIMMPLMNGHEFVEQLRRNPKYRSIPVLMLTAVQDAENEYELLAHGADDYCNKSVRRKVLVQRVSRLLSRRTKANPVGHLLED